MTLMDRHGLPLYVHYVHFLQKEYMKAESVILKQKLPQTIHLDLLCTSVVILSFIIYYLKKTGELL
jgi:hypothetical protein